MPKQTKRETLIGNALGIKNFKAFSTKDSDGDKVPDYRDCSPYNPRKHGVEPNPYMERKISRIPIFVTQKRLWEDTYRFLAWTAKNERGKFVEKAKKHGLYPLLSREAEIYAPLSRKIALSILKKYPELIREAKTTRPIAIFITNSYSRERAGYATMLGNFIVIYGGNILKYRWKKESQEQNILRKREDWIKDIEEKGYYVPEGSYQTTKPGALFGGEVVRHELEHIKQFRKTKKSKKEQKRMWKGEYAKQRGEKQAYRASERMYKKHHTAIKKTDIAEGFGSLFPEEKE